jgi:transmembrane protein
VLGILIREADVSNIAVPRPIAQILALPALDYVAHLALAAPVLISGVVKLLDFSGAMNEVAGLGLGPGGAGRGGGDRHPARRLAPVPDAALLLAGAGLLAGFTVLATLLAHPFWAFEGSDRGCQTATFFEHVAIVSGLAMAALFVNGRSTTR